MRARQAPRELGGRELRAAASSAAASTTPRSAASTRQASARSSAAPSASTSASAPGGADDLQADGQAAGGRAAGQRERGLARDVERDGVGVPLEVRRASTRARPASSGNSSQRHGRPRQHGGDDAARTGASASSTAAVPRRAAATACTYSPTPMRSPSLTACARRRLELVAALGRHDLAVARRVWPSTIVSNGPMSAASGASATSSRWPMCASTLERRVEDRADLVVEGAGGRIAQHADRAAARDPRRRRRRRRRRAAARRRRRRARGRP